MMNNPRSNWQNSIPRYSFLAVLNAALSTKSIRFCRQAAISWLSVYPGDLEVQLFLCKALLTEGKEQQAFPILEKLVRLDPEFAEAQYVLAAIQQKQAGDQHLIPLGCAYAAGMSDIKTDQLPVWSSALYLGRLALQEGHLDEAEQLIFPVISQDLDLPLAAVYHLALTQARKEEMTLCRLATIYHQRWPDCLQFSLCLADIRMRQGDEILSVELMHHCVANDAAGQVPLRMWGKDHRYRLLWPERLEIAFDLPIPAEVTGHLGLNQLAAGDVAHSESGNPKACQTATNIPMSDIVGDEHEVNDLGGPQKAEQTEFSGVPASLDDQTAGGDSGLPQSEEALRTSSPGASLPPSAPLRRPKRYRDKNLRDIEQVFVRLSDQLRKPEVGRLDGRFPVYVVFSSHLGLIGQYGLQTAAVIEREMKSLAEVVSRKAGWGAMVFLPDELESAKKSGLQKISEVDPWKLKLALVDLDQNLAKKGAMIGAVLIVGGPKVVPFHQLPNPTDDLDEAVESDNPYATLDSNYFVPEWPVGRLPGEDGPDPGLLLQQIRRLVSYHAEENRTDSWWRRLLYYLNIWKQVQRVQQKLSKARIYPSFGYTAAAWRQSSLRVFKPVGEQPAMLISPPVTSGGFEPRRITDASLAYYNLHGLPDAVEWYGQKAVEDSSVNEDYPVALGLRDVLKNGRAPRVVFSEACYGGYISSKTEKEAMALRFASIGVLATVASTCIAYGSVSSPLIGADLLGYFFWKNLRQGLNVGYALQQAKLALVQEMNQRQGFLDGEDQKTLISFVLYGDPLAQCEISPARMKTPPRLRELPTVKTICDRQSNDGAPPVVSQELLREVKRVVEKYLPGLEDAEIIISQENENCKGIDHRCPTGELGKQLADSRSTGRIVVTIHSQVHSARHVHQHYARATMDKKGKLVKLVVSR